jgi:hypothetical protein
MASGFRHRSSPADREANKVVLAVGIDSIDPVPGKSGYRQIVGRVLAKGHPVFDAYVGMPARVSCASVS